ncbi:hypothetical protein MO867_04355 [Microbulbifer sp. OS29]|uniref:Uncharacterized protein n=1 Tax=Microbulbifer okhotskensis TaxID=2926617 RepID=A0A9X2J3H8_9GAMM|nr:hypothetical protein [Microbulbifer okhotskensis]MCO1333567.1 hypothetical protein [Microbulbifer okhotskensis]
MGNTTNKRFFHRKQWLSVKQAVDHLSALSEEPLTSTHLADLADEQLLDLYWYRPGQKLSLENHEGIQELIEPVKLCFENVSDWRAIVDILRHNPALPAYEHDTPLLEDADGNHLRITFDYHQRPEPFSSLWYPTFTELVLKRDDLELLEPQLFPSQVAEIGLERQLLLNVIWQLEQLAFENEEHTTSWLAEQLAQRSTSLDIIVCERILQAAEREGATGRTV